MSFAEIYKKKVVSACHSLLNDIEIKRNELTKKLIEEKNNLRWWQSKDYIDMQLSFVSVHWSEAEHKAFHLISLCEYTPDEFIKMTDIDMSYIANYME